MQADRYHNTTLNRIEYRIYSESYMLRIFKDLSGKTIEIYKHEREWDAGETITEICKRGPFDAVYSTKGVKVDDFEASGRYGWTLKDAVEAVADFSERGLY